MTEKELFEIRIALVQAFLREHNHDGILLSRADSFAMATGGKRSYVYTASDLGACSLFVSRGGRVYFVGNTIEKPRILEEELVRLGCESLDFLWFESSPAERVRAMFPGKIVSDDGSIGANVNDQLAPIKALLTEEELERYRRLGALAAEAMTATIEALGPGDTEADIAAKLVCEGAQRRCQVPVALVAADGRIAKYRHPLPTEAPLTTGSLAERRVEGYVMVVGCFLREGLVVSMTRFKRVGDVNSAVPDAYRRICGVDAIMQEATEPGKTLGDVFAACQQAYEDLGFPANEWHNHHQGGATGYAGRTRKGAPGEAFRILDPVWEERVKDITGRAVRFGTAFAWNPSAKGVKSEDTFLLLPDGRKQIITATSSLPQVDLEAVLGRSTDVTKSAMAEAY